VSGAPGPDAQHGAEAKPVRVVSRGHGHGATCSPGARLLSPPRALRQRGSRGAGAAARGGGAAAAAALLQLGRGMSDLIRVVSVRPAVDLG
jgi:hypothetical protein